jgi:hypothetical protein
MRVEKLGPVGPDFLGVREQGSRFSGGNNFRNGADAPKPTRSLFDLGFDQ